MPPVGLEPTVPASARPQTYVLDREATGMGLGVRMATVMMTASVADSLCTPKPEVHKGRCVDIGQG
jgi:hypothetical protein